jgi:predicted metal-dependent hydrolase
VETSKVMFGGTAIAYTILRGRRQKTVAIGVDAIEGVRVRAPHDTPVARIDEIVHRKARWIVERRRRHEDLPPPPGPREFVSGETFLYLGRQYRLKVMKRKTKNPASVRLTAGYLRVTGTRSESEVRRQLEDWYREHAKQRLPERVAIWAEKLGLTPATVLIRDQRKRWGSADAKGNVRLNWRIVQASQRLVDYVVAHELVHLRYADHTRGFWADLGAVMPDYEERREELRQVGRMLVW